MATNEKRVDELLAVTKEAASRYPEALEWGTRPENLPKVATLWAATLEAAFK